VEVAPPVVELPRPPAPPSSSVEPSSVEPSSVEPSSVEPSSVEPSRPPSPIQWLGDRSLLGTAERPAVSVPATGARPVPFSRRDWAPDPAAGTAPRHHRRAAEPDEQPRVPEVAADAVPSPSGSHAVPDAPALRPAPEPQGHARLADILAESGVETPSGRRRRRYRDDDEPDDVLARVLGRN
jgi:hypothetical protein